MSQPKESNDLAISSQNGMSEVPCIFFACGKCKHGSSCRYSHSDSTSRPLNPEACVFEALNSHNEKLFGDAEDLAQMMASLDVNDRISTCFRNIQGSTVTFGSGARVLDVSLDSDHSSIELTDLPSNAQADQVVDILKGFGINTFKISLMATSPPGFGSTAIVKFADSNSAKLAVEKLNELDGEDRRGELSAKAIKTSSRFGKRLQLSTVRISWYRAARSAQIQYRDEDDAISAILEIRKQPLVSGRSLQCHDPRFDRRNYLWSFHIHNLDINTSPQDIYRLLADCERPHAVNILEPTHTLSDERSGETVKEILQNQGTLEYFKCHPCVAGSNSIRATASFTNRETAIRTEEVLNGSKVEALGNIKLSVKHQLSVKYNIPHSMGEALKNPLEQIQETRPFRLVRLGIYPMTHFWTIRLFGDEGREGFLIEAKDAMEKLLSGDVLMKGDQALWDSWLASPEGKTYLKKISTEQKLRIRVDYHNSDLRVFGSTLEIRSRLEEMLAQKFTSENSKPENRTILLDRTLLSNYLLGGQAALLARFGSAVSSLNISRKSITLRGTTQDLEDAHSILRAHEESHPAELNILVDNCTVCHCPAEDALTTSCGHVYCRSCFSNAADDGGHRSFFACLGAEGECKQLFTLREMKNLLPFAKFEQTLQSSFDNYLRTHPTDFRNCLTPDCQAIYRPTTDGDIFTCNACFTSICTTCFVESHDGITCAEYQLLYANGGQEAFNRFKEDNGVKTCPRCGMAITKDEGCNHVECSCKVHICWQCMKVFDGPDGMRDCYRHMAEEHGSYGEEEVEADED